VAIAVDRAQDHIRAPDQSLQATFPPTIMIFKDSAFFFDCPAVKCLDFGYSAYNKNTFSAKIEQWTILCF
jgi:hypothetical protein